MTRDATWRDQAKLKLERSNKTPLHSLALINQHNTLHACAQGLADTLSALGGKEVDNVTMIGIGVRYANGGLSDEQLCAELRAALGGRPETPLPPEAAQVLYANLDELYEGKPVGGRPETGWQPIATAPKDGTRILVYQPDGQWKRSRGSMTRSGEAVQLVYWHQPGNPERAGYWMPLCRPTHWQPLPSPPLQE